MSSAEGSAASVASCRAFLVVFLGEVLVSAPVLNCVVCVVLVIVVVLVRFY